MNNWYKLYTETCDAYNAVLMQHNTGEDNRRAELARLRGIKGLILDIWFETHGFTVLPLNENESVTFVEYAEMQFAWRQGNKLMQADWRNGRDRIFYSRLLRPVYLPGLEAIKNAKD